MDANRRITEKLLRYWLKLREGKTFPLESDIKKEDIADIWDNCFLVKIEKQAAKYIYLGEKLAGAFGGDITNSETAIFLTSPFTLHLQKKFSQMLEAGKPLDDQEALANSRKEIIKYRLVLLPLAGKNNKIEYILGGMRWKNK